MVSKMIDPSLSLQNFQLEILKFRFSLHMVSKMIDPSLSLSPSPNFLLEILKFRFRSAHGLKGDPPITTEDFKDRFDPLLLKDDWPPIFYWKF